MQQKIQSSVGCSQPGKTVDVGEFPDVETGSLPMSHLTDSTPQNVELQPDTDHCRIEKSSNRTESPADRCAVGTRVVIFLIRFYQRMISPYLPANCRFEPSCSNYALQAFRKRGFLAGTVLTIWRLLRCQPFCKGGYDPVPERGFGRCVTQKSPPREEK